MGKWKVYSDSFEVFTIKKIVLSRTDGIIFYLGKYKLTY